MNTENLIILIVLCGASLVWISVLYKAWQVRNITMTPIEKPDITIGSAGYEIFRVLKNIFLWTFPCYLWWFIGNGSYLQEQEVAAGVVIWVMLFIFSFAKVGQSINNSDKSKDEEQSGVMKPLLYIVGFIICCFVPVLFIVILAIMFLHSMNEGNEEHRRNHTHCSSCMGEVNRMATRCPHCTAEQ